MMGLTDVRIDALPARRFAMNFFAFIIAMLAVSQVIRNSVTLFLGLFTLIYAVQIIEKRMRRGVCAELETVLTDNPDLPLAELSKRFLRPRLSPIGVALPTRIYETARALAAHGRVAETIRCSLERSAVGIEPVTVPFEAQPLDESELSFRSIQSGLCGASASRANEDSDREPGWLNAPEMHRVRKNIHTVGWFVIFASVPGIVFLILYSWFQYIGRASGLPWWMYAFFLAPMFVVLFTGIVRSSTEQLLVVPGGLLMRKARWRDPSWRLHLFERRRSVLVLHQFSNRHWHVCIADEQDSLFTRVTNAEAEFLLRGWLSPLEPPPVKQLSDLQ